MVSIGGLVVAHVGRRLLLGRTPRQCAMPHHHGNLTLQVYLKTFAPQKFTKIKGRGFLLIFTPLPFFFLKMSSEDGQTGDGRKKGEEKIELKGTTRNENIGKEKISLNRISRKTADMPMKFIMNQFRLQM